MLNNKNSTPLVSVVMPVYNAGDFLVEAIESILLQTYQNFELIIVDDASTDSSPRIIRKYQLTHPKKIRVIWGKQNLNCGGDMCANQGILVARGKYIARMDADDIADSTRLGRQVAFLEANPEIFLVGSHAYVIDAKGTIIGQKREPQTQKDIYRSYCTFHPLIHPTVMLRNIDREERFSYDIKYSANNDYYTFFKLLCLGKKFANLPDKLLYYRIHGKNDTFVNIKEKFLNTLKVRVAMVVRYGYKLKPRDFVVTIIQSILIFLLPERLTKNLYLFAKGIITRQDIAFALRSVLARQPI